MKDKYKTKRQLIEELEELRQQLSKANESSAIREQFEGRSTDITDHRQSELSIKQGKERYEILIRNIPDAVYSALPDETGTTTFMSPRWKDWTGYAPEKFYSDPATWPKCIHPEDRDKAVQAYSEAIKMKREYIAEYRVMHRETGKVRYLRDHGIPIKDKKGNVIRVDGIATDLTEHKCLEMELHKSYQELEKKVGKRTASLRSTNKRLREEIARRKESEVQLRESEAIYRKLMETANDAIFIADADTGIIVNANKKAGKLLGMPPEKIIGMDQKEMHAKEDEAYYRKLFSDNAQKEGGIILDDIFVWHRNGYRIPVEVSSSAVMMGGRIVMQGIFRDITDRKQAEEALKKSEEKYYSLIEHANDAIVSINKAGMIMGFNLRAEKMFGYAREEILGKPSYLLVVQEHRENQKRKLQQFAATGTNSSMENKINEGKGLRKDGTEFDIEFSYYILDIHEEPIATAIIRDIKERKKAEAKLIHNQEQLRSLASQLTKVEEQERRNIASYLHDHLGQELFAMKLQLEQMKQSISSHPTIKVLESIIERTNHMMSNMRSMSYALSPPVLYELGLEAALEWIVEEMRTQRAITVTFHDDGQVKPLDETVEVLLFQAVRELLNNVVRHAKARHAEVFVARDNAMAVIQVNDDGIGLEGSKIDASQEKAQGFGLYSIKERLRYIGGDLTIESASNRGTRITLKAPLKS